jgi:endonuclease/exonuclease/phosphatase (EEP) superfamily protein YafD
MAFVHPRAAGLPIIVGGDFNAVARDPALSPVRNLIDSFDAAGRGWCDTAPNELPFARIDRVYASAGLRVLASTAIKTQHSDHRMLIVDVAAAREQR